MSAPPTVAFKEAHCAAVGQHGCPGAHHGEASACAGAAAAARDRGSVGRGSARGSWGRMRREYGCGRRAARAAKGSARRRFSTRIVCVCGGRKRQEGRRARVFLSKIQFVERGFRRGGFGAELLMHKRMRDLELEIRCGFCINFNALPKRGARVNGARGCTGTAGTCTAVDAPAPSGLSRRQ